MKKSFSSRQGFTLIELMIVIVILGLLMSTVLPKLTGAQARARDTARMADLTNIQQILEVYYGDYNFYPVSEADAEAGSGECIGADADDEGVGTGIDSSLKDYVKGGTLPTDPNKNTIIGAASGAVLCSTAGINAGKYYYKPLWKNGVERQGYLLCAQAETWQKATIDLAGDGGANSGVASHKNAVSIIASSIANPPADEGDLSKINADTDLKTAMTAHLTGKPDPTSNVKNEATDVLDSIMCLSGQQ